MEKRLSLLLIIFISSVCVFGQQISEDDAKLAAIEFLTKQPISQYAKTRGYNISKKVEVRDLQLADSRLDDKGLAALYVFNIPDNQGFVIVSADKKAEPILGFSHVGSYTPDNMPCCLQFLLDNYARQISYAREHPSMIRSKKASSRTGNRTPIAPLVESRWGQGSPFNDYCPEVDGFKCPTGCVATAMAQILYYHKWPERGIGSHGYDWYGSYLQADFGNTDYHFEKMMDVYENFENYTTESAHYVAQLMYHCGVSVNMDYRPESSSSYTVGYEFSDYFGYSKGHWNLSVDKDDLDSILSRIYSELSRNRPLYFSGIPEYGGGHAFICDGYSQDDFLHFNFGWEGYEDDYFKITAIYAGGINYSYSINVVGGLIPKRDVEEVDVDGIHYECIDDMAFLVDGSGAKGDLVIPSKVSYNGKQYEITSICSKAFMGNNNINSVSIPSCIDNLSDSIFSGCKNIRKLVIKDGDMPLMETWNSFEGLWGTLEDVYIGRDCDAGFGINGLKSLTIGSGVKEERWWLKWISSSQYLETIEVVPENSILSAEDGVLFNKNKTRLIAYLQNNYRPTYSIPATVISIDSLAFSYTPILTSIIIPASVEQISPNAFYSCDQLKELNIDENNRSFVFDDMTLFSYDKTRLLVCLNKNGYEKVAYEMPNSVTRVDDYAFCGVYLSSISLSENLEILGDCVFMYAGSDELKSLLLPSSLYSIGQHCFLQSTVNAIYVDNKNLFYADVDGVLTDKSKTSLICVPSGRTGAYSIPEGISLIESYAFDNCSFSSVYIPKSVSYIRDGAFYSTRIDSLIINNSEPPYSEWAALYYLYDPSVFVPEGSIPLYINAVGWSFLNNYYEMSQEEMNKWLITNDIKKLKTSTNPYSHVYYNLKGSKLLFPKTGINIIRTDDGKYKKILIK